MPVLKIVNMAGKETGEITLSDAVFGAEVNATVLHTASTSGLSTRSTPAEKSTPVSAARKQRL